MKTYRQSLDELHFTREEKNAMADRLTAGESRGGGKVRSIRRTVAVGVAAALLMTMGVGAAVTLTPAGEVFASVFGGAPAQTEIMDRMGVPIGASDTSGGVTITADAIIGDTYSYAVVYSIARDDGQPLAEDLTPLGGGDGPLPLTFDQADTDIGMLGGSHGTAYFYDADPADNAIQYVEMMTADTPIEPGTATATFQNLYLRGEDIQDRNLLAEGSWKIRFQFQFPDSGVSLEAGQTFRLNGMEATLDRVTISPLSIQVGYTVWAPLIEASAGFQSANQAFFAGGVVFELLGSCLVIPLAEELLYRGVVERRLSLLCGSAPAIVLSAVIFGVMHWNVVQFLYAGILGLLLAWLLERTGFLYAPVLAHIGANVMAVVRSETGWLDFAYQPTAAGVAVTVLLFAVAAFAVLLVKKGGVRQEEEKTSAA